MKFPAIFAAQLLFLSVQLPSVWGGSYRKIWLIAVPKSIGSIDSSRVANLFANPISSLLQKVCDVAGKQCKFPALPGTSCVTSGPDGSNVPGPALFGEWVDGCFRGVNEDRLMFYESTLPIQKAGFVRTPLYVRKYDPRNFSSFKFKGLRIGFPRGTSARPLCFEKEFRVSSGDFEFVIFDTVQDGLSLLKQRKVDGVFFMGGLTAKQADGLRIEIEDIACINEVAVLVKPGSLLPKWFNPAFQLLRRNGYYENKFCKELLKQAQKVNPTLTLNDVCIIY